MSRLLHIFSLVTLSGILLFAPTADAAKTSAAHRKATPAPAKSAAVAVNPIEKIKKLKENNCIVELRSYIVEVDAENNSASATMGAGSAVSVAIQGTNYMLTNAHVIDGATEAWALFESGITPKEMRIKGYDKVIDIALLTFIDKNFHPPCVVPLGNSDTLSAGDSVYAIGTSFERFMFSKGYVMKTKGRIVSGDEMFGINAMHLDAIYSDININPGFSGSPLFNENGELVGLNEGVLPSPPLLVPVPFSIPVNLIKRALPKALEGGEVRHGLVNVYLEDSKLFTPPDKYAGITLKPRNGPVVLAVALLSSAERAGIEKNDMIVTIGNIPTPTVRDFYATMIFKLQPQTVVKLTILRTENGENVYKTIDVPVEEFTVSFH